MIIYDENYGADIERCISAIPNINTLVKKNIYITGVTGLICSSVCDILLYLNKKMNTNINLFFAGRSRERVKNRFSMYTMGKDYTFSQFDALMPLNEKIAADYIIHGAGNSDPNAYWKQPVETMLANIIGINSLLKMAVEKKCTRVLYISSSEVYGKKDSKEPFVESDYGFLDILNSRACYPSAKRASETLCIAYGQEFNIDTVIVRPGHIFGPSMTENDSKASAQFARDAAAGRNITMKSSGAQVRSYCVGLDCASAILAVLINGKNGSAYNISNPNSVVSIRDLAETFADTAGVKVVFENPSDEEKLSYNLMENSSLDSAKLESLGWKPQFSLEEAVKRTINGISKPINEL